jgi:murein DD-endopeptidase MepM/ murein hydrolase activator NlpD
MDKRFCLLKPLWGWIFAAALLAPARAEVISIGTPLGAKVDLEATALSPGGIIVARLTAAPAVQQASIKVGKAIIRLGPPGSGGLEPFGLVGLDLGLEPGPQAVSLTVRYDDGRTETTEASITIDPRDFPQKKLTVAAKYVTPPREVEERIQRESELLGMIYGLETPRWRGEGPFVVPHEGKMAANFGERRVYNNVPRSSHAGVDIAAPAGAPVRAANSGRVVLSRDLYFSGKTVIIDHGLGLLTVYCHFSELRVKRGEDVEKGSVIGLAGSTGRSTGPHLHWSARLRQSRVDPAALVGRLALSSAAAPR